MGPPLFTFQEEYLSLPCHSPTCMKVQCDVVEHNRYTHNIHPAPPNRVLIFSSHSLQARRLDALPFVTTTSMATVPSKIFKQTYRLHRLKLSDPRIDGNANHRSRLHEYLCDWMKCDIVFLSHLAPDRSMGLSLSVS